MASKTLDFATKLKDATANLLRSIYALCGRSPQSLESQVQYIQTAYPHMRPGLEKVSNRLVSLIEMLKIAVRSQSKSNSPHDLDESTIGSTAKNHKSHPDKQISENLSAIFESIDDSLNFMESQRNLSPPTEPRKQSRKRLKLERDNSKIISVSSKNIFIPTSHPFAQIINDLKFTQFEGDDKIELKELSMINLPSSIDTTPYIWIDTLEALQALKNQLQKVSLMAIDLENHSFHSYNGFTCLLQISSHEFGDAIVDTIKLRDHVGPVLNSIFADPGKLKIFHGSQSDVQWLQRDFNIFIVNMFDTFHASKALDLPSHSLAALLSMYLKVELDKSHQMSDWRVRPLPHDMERYARLDTHHLIRLYKLMKADLRKKGGVDLVRRILQRSSQSALSLFRPPIPDPNGWRVLCRGASSVKYGERDLKFMRAIYEWREKIAEKEDQSPAAVLPAGIMHRLVQCGTRAYPNDPETVLRSTNNFVLHAALDNIDSLRTLISATRHPEAINHVNDSKVTPIINQKPQSHIFFSDEDTETTQIPTDESITLINPVDDDVSRCLSKSEAAVSICFPDIKGGEKVFPQNQADATNSSLETSHLHPPSESPTEDPESILNVKLSPLYNQIRINPQVVVPTGGEEDQKIDKPNTTKRARLIGFGGAPRQSSILFSDLTKKPIFNDEMDRLRRQVVTNVNPVIKNIPEQAIIEPTTSDVISRLENCAEMNSCPKEEPAMSIVDLLKWSEREARDQVSKEKTFEDESILIPFPIISSYESGQPSIDFSKPNCPSSQTVQKILSDVHIVAPQALSLENTQSTKKTVKKLKGTKFDAKKQPDVRQGPSTRLGTAPRSGNRSMTFTE